MLPIVVIAELASTAGNGISQTMFLLLHWRHCWSSPSTMHLSFRVLQKGQANVLATLVGLVAASFVNESIDDELTARVPPEEVPAA